MALLWTVLTQLCCADGDVPVTVLPIPASRTAIANPLPPMSDLPSTLRPLVIHTPVSPPLGDPSQPYPQSTWPSANPFPLSRPVYSASPRFSDYPGAPTTPVQSTPTDKVLCDATPTNLWGLESQRFFRSSLCPSPAGPWVAYTEMTFSPALRQTDATLYISPLLPQPSPTVPTPRPRTWWERHLWDKLEPVVYPDLYPPPPPVDYDALNQNPSYARQRSIPLLKLTFQPPFEFSTLQVEAWSTDGTQLWVVQKTGKLHLGWQAKRRWHIDLANQSLHRSTPQKP